MQHTTWTEANIPDQHGRVAVVTGATSGIGFETARALAQKGARVILAVRDEAKGRNAVEEIRRAAPSATLEVRPLDLVSASAMSFPTALMRRRVRAAQGGVHAASRTITVDGGAGTVELDVHEPGRMGLRPASSAPRAT